VANITIVIYQTTITESAEQVKTKINKQHPKETSGKRTSSLARKTDSVGAVCTSGGSVPNRVAATAKDRRPLYIQLQLLQLLLAYTAL
jgi:hypothetical protein